MKHSITLAGCAALALAAVAAPLAASAQDASGASGASPWYGALGYTDTRHDGASLGSLDARIGRSFTPNLGAELEIGAGVDGESASHVSPTAKGWLDSAIAAYGVATLPVTSNFSLLGRLGVGETKFAVSDGFRLHENLASLNYGVGAAYQLTPAYAVRADYTRKSYDHNGGDSDTWSLSLVRKF